MITVETLGSSSRGNCYRLLSGGRSLLLECGLPWAQIRRALNFKTADLDGCLVSHHHKDHSRAAADVLKAGVDLYATQAAFDAMEIPGPQHRFHPLTYRLTINIGPWRVMAFEAVHDAPGTVGFWITDQDGDKLVFLTDSAFAYYTFPGTNVFMVEANFSEQILQRNVEVAIPSGRGIRSGPYPEICRNSKVFCSRMRACRQKMRPGRPTGAVNRPRTQVIPS